MERQEQPPKPNQCPKCGERFNTPQELEEHQKRCQRQESIKEIL